MKLQFGSTCYITIYKRDEKSRKFKQVVISHKAKGFVLIGEPRSLTLSNGKRPDILIYIEPYQHYKLEMNKDVAYVEVSGNFLADL